MYEKVQTHWPLQLYLQTHHEEPSFFPLKWHDWVSYNFKYSTTWQIIFSVTIWHILSYRKNVVFNLKTENSASFYNKLWAYYTFTNNIVHCVNSVPRPSTSHSARIWAPPQTSYFKLNTDGSWLDINNAGGGVLRCDKGVWHIGFSIHFNSVGPASAEHTAIKEGLLIAWERKITHLELKIDAQALKYMFENPRGYKDHQRAPIITDIVSLLKRNWAVTILHVKRDANLKVAHGLADIGRKMNIPKAYHFQPPPNVRASE